MTSPASALPAWGLQSKLEANKKNVVSGLGANPVIRGGPAFWLISGSISGEVTFEVDRKP